MPTIRKAIGHPGKNVTVVGAARAPHMRLTQPQPAERRNRAVAELMREIGYAYPEAVTALYDLR